MKYTDAHCHITNCPHTNTMCCIYDAINESDWDKVIEFSNSENIFACIGVHPWFLDDIKSDWESRLYEKLVQNPTIMVGEIGLDKHKPNLEHQIQIFVIQMEIAAKLNRPVHLHCVGAWDKILHILKAQNGKLPPVILAHSFNDNPQIIGQIAEKYNVYFSYNLHDITEKNTDIIRSTPFSRILTESDASDPTTQIQHICASIETISKILNFSQNETANQIYNNFQRMVSYVRPIE